jgi:hypothetical protein
MHKAGLNVNFIKLMGTYLSDRKIKVRVNNVLSTERIIRAGVPQGSVLGPSLFNFYIHDLPEFSKTNLALYADTAIYAQAALLQNRLHLRQILKFFDRWKLKLNESKTELIIFSRSEPTTNFSTLSKLTITKLAVNYLGITLDSRLNFKLNIKNKLTKANHAIRIIYPLIKRNSKLTTENKIQGQDSFLLDWRQVLSYDVSFLNIGLTLHHPAARQFCRSTYTIMDNTIK